MFSDPFSIAADAAAILEEMGFVAVARKRDGRVLLELWKVVEGERRMLRDEIRDASLGPDAVARSSARKFERLSGASDLPKN